MKRFSLAMIFLSLALLVLSACSPAAPQTTVEAASIEDELLIAQGRLQPVQSQDQSFSIPGQVAEVLVKDGDSVQVGQVLAKLAASPETAVALARAEQELLAAQQALDTLKESADVTLAQAKLAQSAAREAVEKASTAYEAESTSENLLRLEEARLKLETAWDTQTRLERGKGVDGDQLAALEARLASAQAGLDSAKAAVEAHQLKATIPGTVVDVELQAGQKVTAGQPVLTVADFSSWVVKTDNLTEMDVISVQVGQPVQVVLDAMPDQTLMGEVTHINMRFEEKRGDVTYTVTAVLKDTNPQMRWGMTGAVQVMR